MSDVRVQLIRDQFTHIKAAGGNIKKRLLLGQMTSSQLAEVEEDDVIKQISEGGFPRSEWTDFTVSVRTRQQSPLWRNFLLLNRK